LAKTGPERSGMRPGTRWGKGHSTVFRGQFDVGDTLRSYVLDRVMHTVEKFIGRETTWHVRIEKEHGGFKTNCSIHLWQGMSL
jgi:hypothetical protein